MKTITLLTALLLAPLAAPQRTQNRPLCQRRHQPRRKDTPAQRPENSGAQVGRDASGRPVLLVDGQPEALNPGVLLWDGPAYAQVFGKAELEQLVVWVKN